MEKSKLIDLLRSFDQAELRKFNEFIKSPYFNKNEEVIALSDYLVEVAPEFTSNNINKEVVYNSLFPGQALDKKHLGHLMNYLLKLGEQFLAIEKFRTQDQLSTYYTLSQFVERQLDKHYNYLLHKTKQVLANGSVKDGEAYYQHYLTSKAEMDYFTSKRLRKFDPSLQSTSDDLDKFYFFHKLKYCCEMLNRQSIIAADYQLNFIEEVQAHLLQRETIDPLIEIYLRIYLSTANPDDEIHFEKLIQLIDENAETINQKMMREIYLNAINYCARKIRKGKAEYTEIMLNLYTKGIENRALFDEGILSQWTYTNVVKLALRLKKFEWGEEFINTHSNSLQPRIKEDAKHYNLAELYFHKRDYEQVLTHLNQLHFTDLQYHVGSRLILLKTYCEQNAEEPLLSLLASFTVYLRRNKKISLTAKKTCLNFCNLLNQILRRNPAKWEKIGKEIKETQPLAERPWLLQLWEQNR